MFFSLDDADVGQDSCSTPEPLNESTAHSAHKFVMSKYTVEVCRIHILSQAIFVIYQVVDVAKRKGEKKVEGRSGQAVGKDR